MTFLEQSILSGCLTELIPKIVDKVRPEFFEDPKASKIFTLFLSFYNKSGLPFSKESFTESIKELNVDDRMSLGLILEQLTPNPDRALVMVRLEQFIKEYKARELKSIKENIAELDFSSGDEVRQGIEKKLIKLASIENRPIEAIEFTSKDAQDKLKGIIKRAKESKGIGVKTGIGEIDDALLGGFPGDLWVYCAPSNHGKSTMLMNHAYFCATKQNKNVVFASAEMSQEQCLSRFYALHAYFKYGVKIDVRKLRGEGLSQRDEDKLIEASEDLASSKYGRVHFCLANKGQTIAQIHQFCEDINKTCKIDAVFVDYFDRLGAMTKDANARHDVVKGETYNYAKSNFALGFDNNRGVFLCTAHQANTEGARQGAMNEGVFKKENAADTAHAYRAPDVFISIFKACEIIKKEEDSDDFKAFKKESVMAILKSRDGGQIYPFVPKVFVNVTPECGAIESFDSAPPDFSIAPTEQKDLDLEL